jgi:hypothetical protein
VYNVEIWDGRKLIYVWDANPHDDCTNGQFEPHVWLTEGDPRAGASLFYITNVDGSLDRWDLTKTVWSWYDKLTLDEGAAKRKLGD